MANRNSVILLVITDKAYDSYKECPLHTPTGHVVGVEVQLHSFLTWTRRDRSTPRCGLQSSVDLYSSNSEVSAGFRKYEAKSLALSSPYPDLSEINDQLQQHLF